MMDSIHLSDIGFHAQMLEMRAYSLSILKWGNGDFARKVGDVLEIATSVVDGWMAETFSPADLPPVYRRSLILSGVNELLSTNRPVGV